MYDMVLAEMRKRRLAVRMMLKERYENTKPFGMERKMTPDEMLAEYENQTSESIDRMIQERGRHETNQYLMEMEQLKNKKQGVI